MTSPRTYIPGLHHTSLGACSAPELLSALTSAGVLVLWNVLPEDVVRKAYVDAKVALNDSDGYVSWQTFNKNTRAGYTPPGVEGKKGGELNWNRHFFDYRPGLVALDPAHDILEPIHNRLVEAGCQILTLFEMATCCEEVTAAAQNGPHILRVAECLNDTVDSQGELFPEHRDFGLITFFVGGSSPGLQILVNGVWIDAPLNPEDVLVGAGTLLAKYDSRVRPLRHRIMASSARRVSLFQFIEPSPDTLLPGGELAGAFFERTLAGVRKD